MTLQSGFHQIPPGHIATVVTHLEMTARPAPRSAPAQPNLRLVRQNRPSAESYRSIFKRIGQDYLWFSRLTMPESKLREILDHPDNVVFTLQRNGVDLALLELDFRESGSCELAFFGVDRELIGTGAGRALMNHAIEQAFEKPIRRFHVHTCTLDSPQALAFYIKSGFTPVKQEIEIAPDPRVTGDLPPSAAPQIPMFRP